MASNHRLKLGTLALGASLIVAGLSLPFWARALLDAAGLPAWLGTVVLVTLIVAGTLLLLLAVFETTRTPHPLVHTDTLHSQLPGTMVQEAIEHYVTEAGGQQEGRTDGHIDARFGSQLALRLMGVMTQYGVDRLPYRLQADITQSPAGTQVGLTLTSDEGWYLTRLKMADRAYEARFAYVTAVLQTRLSN